jgi:hypothetical protein
MAYAVKLGQVGPILFLLFAIGWRWLDEPIRLGVSAALGTAISGKLATGEVDYFAVVFPEFFPGISRLCSPFLGKSHVSYWSIHPDIDHKFIVSRKFNSPFQVSRNAPVSKPLLYPANCVVNRIAGPSKVV